MATSLVARAALAATALTGACAADPRAASLSDTCQLGVVTDGAFAPLQDHGRADAVFGTQGALMLVLSLELPSSAATGTVTGVEVLVGSERYPDGLALHERRELRRDSAHAYVDALFVVVEYVGPKFDLTQERTVSVDAWSTNAEGAATCEPAHLTLNLDVIGEPYVLHPRGG